MWLDVEAEIAEEFEALAGHFERTGLRVIRPVADEERREYKTAWARKRRKPEPFKPAPCHPERKLYAGACRVCFARRRAA